MVAQGLDVIRRREGNSYYYFAVNTRDQVFDGWVSLGASAGSVAIFDPLSEEKGLALLPKGMNNSTEIYLQLEPGESCVLKHSRVLSAGHSSPTSSLLVRHTC